MSVIYFTNTLFFLENKNKNDELYKLLILFFSNTQTQNSFVDVFFLFILFLDRNRFRILLLTSLKSLCSLHKRKYLQMCKMSSNHCDGFVEDVTFDTFYNGFEQFIFTMSWIMWHCLQCLNLYPPNYSCELGLLQ